MLVSVRSARTTGMITDLVDYALPPDVWTLVQNARPDGASLVRGPVLWAGSSPVSPEVLSNGMLLVQLAGDSVGLYSMQRTTAVVYRGGDTDQITRVSSNYTYNSIVNQWSMAAFNGFVVAVDRSNHPQSVAITPTTTAVHPNFVDLPNWNSAHRARLVFGFKSFLVTAHITKSSVEYGRLVKWSHSAAVGSLPSSWDESDETLDAGENVLTGNESSSIVAVAPMDDAYLLYTTTEVWLMRFIGGPFIFSFERILQNIGAANLNSVVSFNRSQHVVLTPDLDIHLVSMGSSKSILSQRIKKTIGDFAGNYSLAKAVHNPVEHEIWFLFAAPGIVEVCTLAALWNYRTDSWTLHTVPDVSYACSGIWANTPFGDAVPYAVFNSGTSNPAKICIPYPKQFSITENVRGSLPVRLERTGLCVKGVDNNGGPVIDYDTVAMFQEFRPKVKGTVGGTLSISFGVRQEASEAVSFGSPQTYTIGTTNFLPVYLTGRLLDIRIDHSSLSQDLTLEGYDLDVVPLARM